MMNVASGCRCARQCRGQLRVCAKGLCALPLRRAVPLRQCAPALILFGPSLTAAKAALRVVAKLLTNRLLQCCCRCQVITRPLTAEAANYPLPSRRHITANVWALGSGYFFLFRTCKGHTADSQKRLYSLASARDRQNLDHAFSAFHLLSHWHYMDEEVQ